MTTAGLPLTLMQVIGRVVAFLCLCAPSLVAATFTVTVPADSGPGSLRQAILDANATPGRDRIVFTSDAAVLPLPPITDPADIDGSSASGGRHAVTLQLGSVLFSFARTADGSMLRDLTLTAPYAIDVDGASDVVIASNTFHGNVADYGYRTLIGGVTPAEGNTFDATSVLSFHASEDVRVLNNTLGRVESIAQSATFAQNTVLTSLLTSSMQTVIEGNTFMGSGSTSIHAIRGLSINSVLDLEIANNQIANASAIGIHVEGGTKVVIRDNVISGHTTGVAIDAGSSGVQLFGNRIFGNTIAIDLNLDGPTANDPAPDADSGANRLQNYPVLTSATLAGGSLAIAGTLTSAPLTQYEIELFADEAGDDEARLPLMRFHVTTDAAGNATFSQSLVALPGVDIGDVVTATATNVVTRNTSEVSTPFVIAVPAAVAPVPAASAWALIAMAAMLALLGMRSSTS